MKINQENKYRTQDLALSAYLNLNFPILSLEKLDQFKFQFVFEDSTSLQKEIDSLTPATPASN